MRRIELGPRPLSIGRAESCDVRLDVPGVDDEHAKVSEVALVAMGPDCAIGDVPLDAGGRRLVMPGDEVQIGSVVLALEGEDPSLLPPRAEDAPQSPALGRLRPVPLVGPRIRVVEGSNFGDELVLAEEGRPYVVGRAPKCDLVLEDREVSREHLKLVRKGYRVYLHDPSSTRGSWLGRAAVYQGSTVEWTRPRMLKVGATVLSLELPEEVRRAAPPAQASAPMTPPPRSRTGGFGSTPAPPLTAAPYSSPSSSPSPSSAPDSMPPAYTPAPVMVVSSGPGGAAALTHGAASLDEGSASGVRPGVASASTPPPGSPRRTAWKKKGATIGRGAGLLLLLLAGAAVLGVILVVFSLME
jgi:pSer/pThr/pTyr-binding forkhead associated (FHA) protein